MRMDLTTQHRTLFSVKRLIKRERRREEQKMNERSRKIEKEMDK